MAAKAENFFDHSRDPRDIKSSKDNINNRDASNSRDLDNSWDLRNTNNSNSIGRIMINSNSRGNRTIVGMQHLQEH
jgi:hypothetical protein